MSPNTVTRTSECWALFLDVDGTLLEIAATPSSVCVPDELKHLLMRLTLRLDGAVALVSGRDLDDLDELFMPLRMCAAGIHGCVLREASGCVVRPPINPGVLSLVRYEVAGFVRERPGLILEDKGYGFAVHYRLAPEHCDGVRELLLRLCARLGHAFRLQSGKSVLELRPSGYTKGTSIAQFMTQRPFSGRTPIFIGDDATDEDGFRTVNELGGISIKVGDAGQTCAQHRLRDVNEVRQWLETLPPPRLMHSCRPV
jgi:trehalose 6-phosphate phosphatase